MTSVAYVSNCQKNTKEVRSKFENYDIDLLFLEDSKGERLSQFIEKLRKEDTFIVLDIADLNMSLQQLCVFLHELKDKGIFCEHK